MEAPEFTLNQKVTARAFVDCFGKQVEECRGLTVDRIFLSSKEEPNHWRYHATDNGTPYPRTIEGAGHFFKSADDTDEPPTQPEVLKAAMEEANTETPRFFICKIKN